MELIESLGERMCCLTGSGTFSTVLQMRGVINSCFAIRHPHSRQQKTNQGEAEQAIPLQAPAIVLPA
jgi:hypothetical protein